MAYWWVFQNRTYKEAREGGYLWAAFADRRGTLLYHWTAVQGVRPGDIILCCTNKQFEAVAVAKTAAYESPRPAEFGDKYEWQDFGRRVDVVYQGLPNPLSLGEVAGSLIHVLPERYSPLNKSGTGIQGYLFKLEPGVGKFLLKLIGLRSRVKVSRLVAYLVAQASGSERERKALLASRRGRGPFREAVIRSWLGRCGVTGCAVPEVLEAVHIKPWIDSNNRERLDPLNGLLLAPQYLQPLRQGSSRLRRTGV